MKKVLVLANNDIGLYNFRKELLQELIRQDYKVYISLPYGERIQDLQAMGCEYIKTHVDRRGTNLFSDFKLFLKYLNIFKKVKPDLVITYTIKPNLYGGICSRFMNVPYIANITGVGTVFQSESIVKKIITILYKYAFKKASLVIFENQENRNLFVQSRLVLSEKAVKLNGAGVNVTEFNYEPPNNDNKIRFLFIGRVMKEKGVDELFEAAINIKKEFNNVEFDIVGEFEDDYKGIVENLVSSGVINYYGFQKNVKSFIKSSHCVVLPSYHEGMSNSLLEGASTGRPLIATDIPGCREAVMDGVSGFLCNVKSEKSLLEKFQRFILLSDFEKKQMGKFSREHIERNFDKKIIVQNTVEIVSKSISAN